MAEKKEVPGEETKGGKKKLIIIIVGALLVAGIGAGAAVMLMGGGEPEAAAEVAQEVKPEKGDPTYIEFKPFTVNLGPDDPVGFLQVQIHVLTYFSEVAEEVETHKPLIRNNLTLLFGGQNSADIRSPEGKVELQSKVRESVQEVIKKYGSGGEIDNIFFTNFVMQ